MCLRPLIRIRIGLLYHARIGHLAINTEIFLRRRSVEGERDFYIFLCGKPANNQLLKMIKRRVLVIENRACPLIYWAIKTLNNQSSIWVDIPYRTNEFYELNEIRPQLYFTDNEESKGQELLSKMGIEPESEFVCFFARDQSYLNVKHDYKQPQEWAYHSHRDCDILNYLPAAEYLASKGIYAVRMGHVVEKSLPQGSDRVIDYSSLYRTDFGDIYLLSKCKFFLGSNSGISALAHIFNIPYANANLVPMGHVPLGGSDIFMPKLFYYNREQRYLTFREIIGKGIGEIVRAEEYVSLDIEVRENSSDLILEITKEMLARIEETWETTETDESLQNKFKNIFSGGHREDFPSRICMAYLKEYRYLLD